MWIKYFFKQICIGKIILSNGEKCSVYLETYLTVWEPLNFLTWQLDYNGFNLKTSF